MQTEKRECKDEKKKVCRNGSWQETDFSIKVKKRLIDKRMNQKQLAEMLGVTPGYVCQTIYGHKNDEHLKKKIRTILEIRESKRKKATGE